MRISVFLVLIAISAISCTSKNRQEGTLAEITDTKVLQYAIQGKILYDANCANCHQPDGSGLGRLIPPIRRSDYFVADKARTAKIIKHGQRGEIVVNGLLFDEQMPANPKLTDLEIAQLMTYLYNIWGNREGVIDANQVGKFLRE